MKINLNFIIIIITTSFIIRNFAESFIIIIITTTMVLSFLAIINVNLKIPFNYLKSNVLVNFIRV